jgi:predicted dehydrogenase
MKKNVTVIGFGGQGGWHATHAQNSDVVSLLGIYDIDDKKSEKARATGIHAYASLDEAISDERCDIVVVATPNDCHKEIVVKALLAGKNVVCETPVSMTVDVLDEMLDSAKESGKLFTVHQNRRWDVDYLAMKKIIADGDIGDTIRIESRIHGSRGIPSDWRCHKQYGGGMILDWGVHLIDQMLLLIPENIKKISCDITNITTDEVDDGFRLNLYFESGKTALIEVGTFNFLAMPRFYMQCKGGSAKIEDWRQKAQVAKCLAWHESDVVPVQTAAGITKTMAPRDEITLKTYEIERPVSDVHDFYRNLVKAIDKKEEQIVTHSQIRRVLSVMEAAFKSAELGAPVDFE